MLEILSDRRFRRLFAAQVVALFGTGLASVALGLLAFDLAGESAGLVLGMVFTIKMVAYVTIAPVATAVLERVPRRLTLVVLDLLRASVALALPFVTEVWQVYLLIFVLQAASAGFTPTFQAVLPDILPEEERYTRALSLSRLAYDLENVLSPSLAALLLLFVGGQALFFGTAFGFAASGLLILTVMIPTPMPKKEQPLSLRLTRGMRIYLATPRLRGLLALSFAAAMAGAMVLVNSVVLVRSDLGLSEAALAWTMLAFGAGSMLAALVLPRLLNVLADRPVMVSGAMLMVFSLMVLGAVSALTGLSFMAVLMAWALMGFGFSAVMTPSGRVLRRSAHAEDRPALFAAQFTLSHLCWLLSYPLAGWALARMGLQPTLWGLAALALLGALVALRLWPANDPVEIEHTHDNLPPDHPHLRGGHRKHSHAMVIDEDHPRWGRHF